MSVAEHRYGGKPLGAVSGECVEPGRALVSFNRVWSEEDLACDGQLVLRYRLVRCSTSWRCHHSPSNVLTASWRAARTGASTPWRSVQKKRRRDGCLCRWMNVCVCAVGNVCLCGAWSQQARGSAYLQNLFSKQNKFNAPELHALEDLGDGASQHVAHWQVRANGRDCQ